MVMLWRYSLKGDGHRYGGKFGGRMGYTGGQFNGGRMVMLWRWPV